MVTVFLMLMICHLYVIFFLIQILLSNVLQVHIKIIMVTINFKEQIMKKYFLFMLMLLLGSSFYSCKEDELNIPAELDRERMTMFITDNNRGKGDDDPYNCKAEGPNGNDIHLYWYGINDCAGYQIQQALQPHVSGGPDAWATTAQNGLLLLDTIVGPMCLIWSSKPAVFY